MPLYEYECTKCGERTELLQRFDDEPLKVCPKCGGPVRKLLSAPAVQFKGSGWYVTDYARSGRGAGRESGESGAGEEAGKKTATADAKTPASDGKAGKSNE